MTIKLFVNCPGMTDTTSFYRGMGPLSALPGDFVRLTTSPEIDWTHIAQADVVFQQRPFNSAQLQLAKLAKQLQKPLWIDYDDDLTTLTTDNPAYHIYCHPDAQASIKGALSLADVVSVSTECLARVVKPLAPQAEVVVVENAFNDYLIPAPPEPKPRQKMVMWRGGTSHQRDLMDFKDAIFELYEKFPDWKWVFLGAPIWAITDKMADDRCQVVTGQQIFDYFAMLPRLSATLQIVPLADTAFNHSKSNIAWQEAAYGGAAALCPDWEEWHVPGAINYKDQFEFFDKAADMMAHPEYLPSLAAASWDYISRKLPLSNVNKKRMELLERLVYRKPYELRNVS